MGTRLGLYNLFLKVNLLERYHLQKLTHNNFLQKFFCQRNAQCRIFQRSLIVSPLSLRFFNYKRKTTKEMDTEREILTNDQQQADCLIVRDETAGCLEQTGQNKEAAAMTLSKRAMKRAARADKYKEYKRRKKEKDLQMAPRDDVGYKIGDLEQSSYYFENGIRKVYPYSYVFATHAKGRWVGRTIQDVLETEFGYDQPDDLMKSFERGMIHVNGKRASLDYTLKNNDYISHRTHRHENPVTAAPIEIIENTEDLLVINKPSSIPCHPCGRYRFNSVNFILGKEMGLVNLRNIYRLDRLTSGVLILAKSPEKTKQLMDQMAKKQMQKEYVCRVIGEFPEGTIKVDQPLAALSNKLRLQVVSPAGKSSQTTFTRISYNGKSSVVRCIPHTGRTHQIRVHLQYLGHPILNDAFYNNKAWGSSKGKNGVYEIPFDKVCENMLAEQNEKLWMGGDNPLYEEKLRQMNTKEQQYKNEGKHASVSCIHTDAAGLVKDKCIHVGSASAGGEVSTTHEQGHHDKHICSQDEQNPSIPLYSQPSSTNYVGTVDSKVCSSYLGSGEQTEKTVSSTYCSSSTYLGKAHLPGFEMSRWSVDPSCDLCKKRLIDPEEKQLVMFLHALKYKGLDWEYETNLPDWASDDWNREEEFVLESARFHMS